MRPNIAMDSPNAIINGGVRYNVVNATPNVRRAFQSSVASPNLSQQLAASPRGQIQNRSRKRRVADKLLPEKIRILVPESQAYVNLLAIEKKFDFLLTRKKIELHELIKRSSKIKRRLRIYISHTFMGRDYERESEEGVPMWELRVEGRLLDDLSPTNSSNANPAQTQNRGQHAKRKFSSFCKSLVIELDKDIYGPDNHLVEWHRTPQTGETDGFQVKRPGDRDVKCTIILLLDHQPMKYKLHPRLSRVLGFACDTRAKVIEALWLYIRAHKLQDPIDRDNINCDAHLEQAFNAKRIKFIEIPQRLQTLLLPPDPIVFTHVIHYDKGNVKNTACYDIDVETDDPLKTQMNTFLQNHANSPDIVTMDQKIYDIVEQINEWKTRRDFFMGFAENPVDFIEKWLISQSSDLKVMCDSNGDSESERRATFYCQPQVQEATFRYLYQKVQQKRAELENSLGIKNN